MTLEEVLAKKAQDGFVRFVGEVTASSRGIFTVKCDHGGRTIDVECRPSGRMRLRTIRCVLGDRVVVDCSAYDLKRGRIVWREKR